MTSAPCRSSSATRPCRPPTSRVRLGRDRRVALRVGVGRTAREQVRGVVDAARALGQPADGRLHEVRERNGGSSRPRSEISAASTPGATARWIARDVGLCWHARTERGDGPGRPRRAARIDSQERGLVLRRDDRVGLDLLVLGEERARVEAREPVEVLAGEGHAVAGVETGRRDGLPIPFLRTEDEDVAHRGGRRARSYPAGRVRQNGGMPVPTPLERAPEELGGRPADLPEARGHARARRVQVARRASDARALPGRGRDGGLHRVDRESRRRDRLGGGAARAARGRVRARGCDTGEARRTSSGSAARSDSVQAISTR